MSASSSFAAAAVALSESSLGKRRARAEDDDEGGAEDWDGGEAEGTTTSSTPKKLRFAQHPLAVMPGENSHLRYDGMQQGRGGGGGGSNDHGAPNDQAQQASSSSSSSSSNLVTQATQTSPSLLPAPLPAEVDHIEAPPLLSAAERLRADQLALASRHAHSNSSLWTRSTEYWKEDGNVVFLHGNTLFKFHRSTLTEESDIFRSLFLLPPAQDGTLPQGVSEENPIRWSGPAEELEVILWARYKPQLLLPSSPNLLPRFLSLFKASRKYDFPSLRTWSLSLLQPLITQRAYPSPIWLLKAGLDCQKKEWVYQACEDLIVEGKPTGVGGWSEMQEELMELGRRAGEEGERELERGAVGWVGRVFEEREASHFRAIDFYRMVPKLGRREGCQNQKGKCKRAWSETWHNAVKTMCWKGRRVEDLRAQDFKASLSPLTLLKRMLPTVDDSDAIQTPDIEGQCDHCMKNLRDVLKRKWADEKALLRKRFVDDIGFDGDGAAGGGGGGGGRDVMMG